MEKEKNKLDELMRKQPFRVPEGYFEGFTDDFMSRIPDETVSGSEPEEISLFTRIKPFLYLAAMFVGAMLFINIISDKEKGSPEAGDSNSVKEGFVSSASDHVGTGDDAEFLVYIEEMYADKYAISYIDDVLDNW